MLAAQVSSCTSPSPISTQLSGGASATGDSDVSLLIHHGSYVSLLHTIIKLDDDANLKTLNIIRIVVHVELFFGHLSRILTHLSSLGDGAGVCACQLCISSMFCHRVRACQIYNASFRFLVRSILTMARSGFTRIKS